MEGLLVSPEFLFRDRARSGRARRRTRPIASAISELASRLSFFLWSSIPDDELLEAASSGKLRNPAVLEQQVRRMLADPRADALVTNFVGQWLFLRNLPTRAAGSRGRTRTSTKTCGRDSAARPSCSSAASSARIAACSIC